jgi:hypothetical protein
MRKSLSVLLACAAMLGGCASLDLGSSGNSPAAGNGAEAAATPAKPAPRVSTPPQLSSNERRRPILSTGYAVISIQQHHLPAQQRLLAIRAAKLDAYRGLAEQVYGQYLDGATTVADATLRSDRVRSRVEGLIHGAEVVSIAPVGNDTYELTLSLDRDVMFELRAIYLEEMARLGR